MSSITVQGDNVWRKWLWLALALLWFGTLGYRDIIHPDEGRYAEIAREMAQGGDWITPHLDGLKYFEKPALHYWISAAAFRVFGESEWVARLWPGLSGFLLIVLLHFTAKRLSGERTADYTVLCAASGLWLLAEGHFLSLDMGLVFFMSAALCCFLLAFHADTTTALRRRYLLWMWAAMACAVLTKGLIGAVLPLLVLVFYTLATRQWFVWKHLDLLRGLLVFLAISAPWFIVVCQRNPEFFHFFFIHEHWERYTTTEHERIGSWYYFVPVLLVGLLPWTTLLPQSLLSARHENASSFRPKLFLLVWSVVIFVFFSVSGSKLPSYILPVFPALSLLLGAVIAQEKATRLIWHALAVGAFWLVLALLLLQVATHKTEILDQIYCHWVGVLCAPLAALCFVSAALYAQERKMLATLVLCASTLTVGQVILQGHQVYSPQRSAKSWVQKLPANLKSDAPFYIVSFYNQSLPFYLKRSVTLVNWVDEFELGIQQAPDKAIATEAEFLKAWKEQDSAAAILEYGTYDRLGLQLGDIEELYHDQGYVIVRKK